MPVSYLYFEFLDVGMGECTFIKVGDEKILVDLGSTKSREVAVPDAIAYLKSQLAGFSPKLDLVVFTHPDQDHYNQFPKLVKAVPGLTIGTIWYGGERDDYIVGDFAKFLKSQGAADIADDYFSTAPAWESNDDELQIYMMACNYPTGDDADTNVRSIVLLFKWKGFKILMTGDATKATEKQILKRFKKNNLLNVDVTKVPHHGSETSSCVDFVEATRPTIIVISADNNPGYKLPRETILERYKNLSGNKNAHNYVVYDDNLMVPDFIQKSTKKDLYTTLGGLLQGVQWELKFGSDGTISINST